VRSSVALPVPPPVITPQRRVHVSSVSSDTLLNVAAAARSKTLWSSAVQLERCSARSSREQQRVRILRNRVRSSFRRVDSL
jgi:hypothetical protein